MSVGDAFATAFVSVMFLLACVQMINFALSITLQERSWECTASHKVGEPHNQIDVCDQYTRKKEQPHDKD
jgi:hypothetical protein